VVHVLGIVPRRHEHVGRLALGAPVADLRMLLWMRANKPLQPASGASARRCFETIVSAARG
jgi:hypothetical protein